MLNLLTRCAMTFKSLKITKKTFFLTNLRVLTKLRKSENTKKKRQNQEKIGVFEIKSQKN